MSDKIVPLPLNSTEAKECLERVRDGLRMACLGLLRLAPDEGKGPAMLLAIRWTVEGADEMLGEWLAQRSR